MKLGTQWTCALLAVALCLMPGCRSEARTTASELIEHNALRIKLDPARNRIWMLDVNGVRVYDTVRKRLTRTLSLPKWTIARFTCMPDLVLDQAGSAYVSSNVQARLWRIDSETFEVSEREVQLLGKEGWDMGFGALAFAADGSLLALSSVGRWTWRIDAVSGAARPVNADAALLTTCDLTPQLLRVLESNPS